MSQNLLYRELSKKEISIFLSVIIIGGISFRIIFSDFQLPFNSDNLQYFLFAVDHSLGETINSFKVNNTGWPYFLSFFFRIFDSNNYIDYMILQKIISITISALTVIPIYFLCKKFFSKEYALLGSCLFIFEPRIVQNSTFGITDPLYIMGIVIGIVLLLSAKKNLVFFAFLILGLSISIRSEGLFLIPAFVIIYFIENKIKKESIIRILISLLIISCVIFIITFNQNIENSNNNLFSNIDSNFKEIYSSPETKTAGSPINLAIDGLFNLIKFLGWSQIPIWLIFVPAGLIILLVSKNKNTGIITTLLFFITLPTLYAFSFSNDVRYLFPLYPIFSILSLFFIKKINTRKYPIIKIIIISGLIVGSSIFLIIKDTDIKNEEEKFNLMKKISDEKKIINYFGGEVSYNIPVTLEKINFPSNSKTILDQSMKIINISRVSSFEEYMENVIKNELTHLVIKENNSYKFLDDIFKNENKYPFLTKEYNSNSMDKFQIKIFKINYDKYLENMNQN